ncbi:MAG: site-2 protease family protein [Acidilobus sp.]
MTPAWAVALVAFVAFWGALYILVRGRRGGLTVYPLLLIYRVDYARGPLTGRGRAWAARAYGVVSVALTVLALALFYYVSLRLFVVRYVVPTPSAAQEGFVPLIPGVTIGLSELLYFLIAIGVAIVLHELSHAVVARAVGVPIRSAGFLLLAFIPAAFVEPDEEALRARPLRSKAMIYSAGVASNLVIGVAFMYLLSALVPFLASGVQIALVEPASPAAHAGLVQGMVILAVNGHPVRTIQQGLEELVRAGAEAPGAVNVTLTVLYSGALRNVTVFKPANYTRLGIEVVQAVRLPWLVSTASAMYVINIGLALVNAAPLAIPFPGFGIETDGGQLVREALSRLGGPGRSAAVAVELMTLLLLLSLMTLAPVRLP